MRPLRVWVLPAAIVAAGGCELREITVTTPDDVVIAEIVLRAGAPVQTAYLHRTSTGEGSARVYGAIVEVTEQSTGRGFRLEADADSLCLSDRPVAPAASTGTCYVARGDSDMVRHGARYSLHITLEDGRELTGTTRVPAAFEFVTPRAHVCRLQPWTTFEMRWRASAGAAVYIVSTRMFGLKQALRSNGVQVPGDDPVELIGLSVSAADTTLSMPDELGLFNRFDEELHPILLAIRKGLPPDVRVDGVVAAADRNYVNWVRGGTFNPSGLVRIPSVQGDGYGVFGSLALLDFDVRTTAQPLPLCRGSGTDVAP